MIDKIMQMGRPAAFGLAGVAAGMLLGKSKKQKNQLALGYGAVGAVVGYASNKIQTEEVEGAVQAAAEAEAAAMSGYGWGAPAPVAAAAPAAAASAPAAAAAQAASTSTIPAGARQLGPAPLPAGFRPFVAPSRRRRLGGPVYRALRARRVLPYRRVVYPRPAFRPASPPLIAPRRIIRPRTIQPYRRITYPRPRFFNAVKPYTPRILPMRYFRPAPRTPPSGFYNYYGPSNTAACRFLLAKIKRMESRIAQGLPTFKVGGQRLSASEALPYLEKVKAAYARYCAAR